LGAASVAVFVTLRTLSNVIWQLTAALNSALWPELTELGAAGHRDTLREVHLLSAKVLLGLSFCAAVFLTLTGETIVGSWTRGRIVYSHALMNAFLLLLIVKTFWSTSSTLLAASNKLRNLSASFIASGVVGLALGYLLIDPLGLAGIVYGLAIGELAISALVIPWSACRFAEQHFGRFVVELALRGAPVLVLLYLVVHAISQAFPPESSFMHVLSLGVVTGFLGLGLSYILWLSRSERDRFRTLFVRGRALIGLV
jgi:O-antigen/teichoic acid export membrane protein